MEAGAPQTLDGTRASHPPCYKTYPSSRSGTQKGDGGCLNLSCFCEPRVVWYSVLSARFLLMNHSPHSFRFLTIPFIWILSGHAFAKDISFSRDIRPILSDMCLKCHGPDDKGRKGGLQLDDRAHALKGGKSGEPAIVEGKPEISEIIKRMHSTDPDEMMPPPSMKKSLTPQQIALFEQWIAEGAKYEKHWAFQAPTLPPVPAVIGAVANPIDAFVLEKLNDVGLKPSAPAEKSALLRRVSIDLIGLQPTTEELTAFLADNSPDAYAKAVDRLLASPRYGERWGRKWLDLARYADTNGYEKDRARTIWPYRDWVIKALNADMPFDQFTIEQIAGDLLPNATTDQRIATGFHRNTMLNEEGGIDPLEFRFNAMTDRVATTGAAWLGLTLQCCQCHTHKYDPILHHDYFSIMAFLNNADEPEVEIRDADYDRKATERAAKADRLLADLAKKWPTPDVAVAWQTPTPTVNTEPADPARVLPDGSVLCTTAGPAKVTTSLNFTVTRGNFTSLKLEALTDDAIKGKGPGRTPHGNFVVSEIEVYVAGKLVRLQQPTSTAEQNGYPVTSAVDGNPNTGWGIDVPGKNIRSNQAATFALETPITAASDVRVVLKQFQGGHHTIGRIKVSLGSPQQPGLNVAQLQAKAIDAAFHTWLKSQREKTARWQVVAPSEATSNSPLLTIESDASVFASGDITKMDTYELKFRNLPANITGVRLEALPDDRLPAHGPGMAYYEGPKGDFFLGEFKLSSGGQSIKLTKGTESYSKNNFGGGASAQAAIDGNPETGWTCAGREGQAHEAVFTLEKPLTTPELNLTMMFGRHYACSLGKFRVSFTTQSGDIAASAAAQEVQALLHKSAPTDGEMQRLRQEFLYTAPELANERKEIENLRKPASVLTSLVFKERPVNNPRPTFLHNRGEFTQPTERVSAGVMAFLNPLPPGAPKDRLTFAKWLVSRESPLTARVVVNRAWGTFFGRGIVKTQEDFGFQSDPPSHQQLLDWLAIRFMDDGWSFKKLHRLLVTSTTYQQASNSRAEAVEKDAENKFLWRGPRLRLESEVLRDTALRASGLLSEKMFGPGVFPPQPASITTEGTYGGFNWVASTGEDRYRRTIYTYTKRTAPFAFSTTFDAPTGEACLVRRDMSNTPLQALTMLNDVIIMEAAQALGKRLTEASGGVNEKLTDAYLRCFSRPPTADELASVADFYGKQQARFAASADTAKQVAGDGPPATVAERAAWTAVARALLNLDEFVTKS
jgi:hypothetical protein